MIDINASSSCPFPPSGSLFCGSLSSPIHNQTEDGKVGNKDMTKTAPNNSQTIPVMVTKGHNSTYVDSLGDLPVQEGFVRRRLLSRMGVS